MTVVLSTRRAVRRFSAAAKAMLGRNRIDA